MQTDGLMVSFFLFSSHSHHKSLKLILQRRPDTWWPVRKIGNMTPYSSLSVYAFFIYIVLTALNGIVVYLPYRKTNYFHV